MTLMATTTLRLPEPLKAEADALAVALGISLNALMAVALRDYIDVRATRRSGLPLPSPPTPFAAASSSQVSYPGLGKPDTSDRGQPKQPARFVGTNPKHRCPCGSGKAYGKCHGRPGRVE